MKPARRGALARFGDLPLSWKLLLPSVGLIVVLGLIGGFLIVRDLSARSQAALDLEVSRRSLDALSVVRDRELSLIESANFAANLEGMADAIVEGGSDGAARLLQSVVALKTDLELMAVTGRDGAALVEFARSRADGEPRRRAGRSWGTRGFVRRALTDASARKHIGFVTVGRRTLLAIAAPVCSGRRSCSAVGTAIVGMGMEGIAGEAVRRSGAADGARGGVTIFAPSGRAIASSGGPAARAIPVDDLDAGAVRVNEHANGLAVTTLYAPFEAGGRRLGTLAVSIPVEPTLASVRRTALGLGLILLAAMGGVALIGFLLSRLILRQVRSLVATNRALGSGDLSARAQVHWNDEIGEVGTRLNEMAEQLQAMYESLESRVAERTEEVERLLTERTEFFASISHELRTPLAVILRHAEMLLDDAYRKNGRWRVEAGHALRDSGGQLARLIDDILDLAEAEAGRLDVDLQPVDATAVLAEMRRTIEPLARAAGVRAGIKVPRGGVPMVLADPRRLRQVILNLADNAIKYTPAGGSIEIAVGARAGDVELVVSDTGVGIPPEIGDRIFEPFFRVKGTETQGGQASSGLGLAIARRLVEAHGGALTYEPRRGGGTTFRFGLLRADRAALVPGGSHHEHDDA